VAEHRSAGVTALAVFFGAGAAVAFVAAASLAIPGGWLERIWRLNPRARIAFAGLGLWAPGILAAVGIACLTASIGFARRRGWGYRIGVALVAINLMGDSVNAALGVEPRAIVGIPVAAALLAYLLSSRVRAEFSSVESGRPTLNTDG
jgi:hypothetical protein